MNTPLFRDYFDCASFGMFGFGQAEGQDTVLVAGLNVLSVDGGGQGKVLLIFTRCKAAPVRGRLLWYLDTGFPLEAQRVLFGGDLYLVRIDSRQGDLEHKALGSLVQVRVAMPQTISVARNKAILKQAIHGRAQRDDIVEGVVANKISHKCNSPLFRSKICFLLSFQPLWSESIWCFVIWA